MIPDEPRNPQHGLLIIHASLFRMGTKSMAEAYKILGYKCHHGLDDVWNGNKWPLLERAAEASWPGVGEIRPRPTRQDWDALWGNEYDIATDMASPFVPQLIEAYPEAKVVVVQRDFGKWWPSFQSEMLDGLYGPFAPLIISIVGYIMRNRCGYCMDKVHRGFFGARNKQEMIARSREVYDEYFATIRKIVPAERRLEYKIGDGWGPLCAFLDTEVPAVPFPRVNDRKEHSEDTAKKVTVILLKAAAKVAPILIAIGGVMYLYSRSKP